MEQTITVSRRRTPGGDEQQRRRGDASIAESWFRALAAGRPNACRPGLMMGTKTKTSGGCATRITDDRAIAGERSPAGDRWSREGRRSVEPRSSASPAFSSRRRSPALAFGSTARGGLRLSTTGFGATSDASGSGSAMACERPLRGPAERGAPRCDGAAGSPSPSGCLVAVDLARCLRASHVGGALALESPVSPREGSPVLAVGHFGGRT